MIEEKLYELGLPYPYRGERQVRVYVPVHEEGEKMPVIYMTDGQNLFDEETAKYGCWHICQAVARERENSGKAAVIVGMHNNDPWRPNELTPKSIGEIQCPEEVRPFVAPEGEVFDDFIINTVMPEVEKQFPVKTGRENTAFCGSSSGGIMSFFTALSHPDKYCAAGVFSPPFVMFTIEDLKNWISIRIGENMPYLYIYSGGADRVESEILESVRQTSVIFDELYPSDRMYRKLIPEQIHKEEAWEPIFKDFLHNFLSGKY